MTDDMLVLGDMVPVEEDTEFVRLCEGFAPGGNEGELGDWREYQSESDLMARS